mmetsp:Transcript_11174/g.9553  ORF Transcript_11174/g.9553 Transcript_11174/m.9553 type:complete len:202 (-) Transcript_11174:1143-1748(-)
MAVLLAAYLEESIRNLQVENVMLACEKITKIMKTLIVSGENIREKHINTHIHGQVISINCFFLRMFYEAMDINTDDEINEILQGALADAVSYIMMVVEYINKRTSNFSTYRELKETMMTTPQKDTNKNSYSLVSFDLILNYLSTEDEPLVSISMINKLRYEDFKPIGAFIFSQKWKDALIVNSKINKMLDSYFEDEIAKNN